ncbi:hypothetical protein COLO4_28355 [Corchorus olitorius]|uniref:Uncharacterized protein n=1 Tax=Corchorus olitorius TaxID=93759 RepID=A0A1R3HLD6_9ROSI|nr:hypothetical protein COLO4_28355 [Corchorus olitorius]
MWTNKPKMNIYGHYSLNSHLLSPPSVLLSTPLGNLPTTAAVLNRRAGGRAAPNFELSDLQIQPSEVSVIKIRGNEENKGGVWREHEDGVGRGNAITKPGQKKWWCSGAVVCGLVYCVCPLVWQRVSACRIRVVDVDFEPKREPIRRCQLCG